MKQQPESKPTTYSCGNCGSEFEIVSTKQADAKLDVCSNCHPAYTGKTMEKVTGDRVESFNNRYKR